MPETLTIEPRVRKILGEHLGHHERGRLIPLEFEWEGELRRDLGADSLDEVELCMVIEEEFNIEITDEDVDGWKTAGDILRCVEGKRADG